MPDVSPMLAETLQKPFDGKDWLFEIKWDGYRCLLYIKDSQVLLRSRNGRSLNQRFPRLESIPKRIMNNRARNLIVDGEIVAFKGGRPDFSFLKASPGSAVFVAFDLLYLNDEFLLKVPLIRRRDELVELFNWNGLIYFSEAQEEMGHSLFEFVKQRDIEGVMAKRKDSLYFPGKRTGDWLKIKNFKEETLWVVGYLPSPGRQIGSLLVAREVAGAEVYGSQLDGETQPEGVSGQARVGSPDAKRFHLAGRVSSGLNQKTEEKLLEVFGAPASIKHVHIQGKLSKSELRKVDWIEPFFGVKVQYTEATPGGKLRHPVLKEILW